MQGENHSRGQFIVLEGIDGSGKSTQIRLLKSRLAGEGIVCYDTHEPTDGPIGSLIHQMMTGRIVSDSRAMAALFVADRLDHLMNPVDGICAKIESGVSVLSDRYYFSSYAYNGVDIPLDWVIAANAPCADILRPSVTVFLDVAPDAAMERVERFRSRTELFETRERLAEVREKYLDVFHRLEKTEHVVIVDGMGETSRVEAAVWEAVRSFFGL